MLRKDTVQPGTLELLTRLMQDDRLKDFFWWVVQRFPCKLDTQVRIDKLNNQDW